MKRILILTGRPGNEISYLGGLLSNYKDKLKSKEHLDRDKPRIIYGDISDYKDSTGRLVYKNGQFNDIKKISSLLGFTWEALYVSKNIYIINEQEFNKRLLKRIDFYKPDVIFCPANFFRYNFEKLGALIDNVSFISYGYSCTPNFYYGLTTSDISNKRKALCLFRSFVGDQVNMIDYIIEKNYNYKKYTEHPYVEHFCIERTNNNLLNL